MASKSENITFVPGIGPTTTAMLLAELPKLGKLNRTRIAKRVGVARIVRDSGTMQGRRATFAGRSMVRKTLYMAALVSTGHNRVMREFYHRLVAKGKPKNVAMVAVMRKLLVTLNVMVREGNQWREPTLAKTRP